MDSATFWGVRSWGCAVADLVLRIDESPWVVGDGDRVTGQGGSTERSLSPSAAMILFCWASG